MNDALERAVWTFVQGALGTVGSVPLITDVEAWQAVIVAAATGGIASAISFLKTMAQERGNVRDTRVSS